METPTFLAISSMVGIRICTPFPLNLAGMAARHVQHLLYLSWMQKANHETHARRTNTDCQAHGAAHCRALSPGPDVSRPRAGSVRGCPEARQKRGGAPRDAQDRRRDGTRPRARDPRGPEGGHRPHEPETPDVREAEELREERTRETGN